MFLLFCVVVGGEWGKVLLIFIPLIMKIRDILESANGRLVNQSVGWSFRYAGGQSDGWSVEMLCLRLLPQFSSMICMI